MKTSILLVLLVLIFPSLKGNDTLKYPIVGYALSEFFPRESYQYTDETISSVDSAMNYFSQFVCSYYSGKLEIVDSSFSDLYRYKYVCLFQTGKMIRLDNINYPDRFLTVDFQDGFPIRIKSKGSVIKIRRDSLHRIINADIFFKDILNEDYHLLVQKVYSMGGSSESWERLATLNLAPLKIENKIEYVHDWKFEYLIAGNDTITTICSSKAIDLIIYYGKNWSGKLYLGISDIPNKKEYLIINLEQRLISISENDKSKGFIFSNQLNIANIQNISQQTYRIKEVRDDCRLLYKSKQLVSGEEFKTLILNELK